LIFLTWGDGQKCHFPFKALGIISAQHLPAWIASTECMTLAQVEFALSLKMNRLCLSQPLPLILFHMFEGTFLLV
jgi:hypothetical protein